MADDKTVEVVETGVNRQPYQPYQMMLPQDPVTMIIMLPFLPLILLANAFQSMAVMPVQRPYIFSPADSAPRTKVTSITRTGNTLDIVEKWM